MKSVFLDLKTTILIVSIYFLLAFANCSPVLLPKILEQLDYKTSVDILGNVIKGISGVLGITISILIISIQLYRNKYDDYAIKIILKNKKLKRIISVFIANLVLSYLSLISLNEILKAADINRVYFMLLLFILALIYLFSSIGSVIYSTSNMEILSSLKKDASSNSYLSLKNITKTGNSSEFLKEKDSNPIVEIQKLTFLAIKNNDEIFFEQLCEFRKNLICDTSRFSISNNIHNLGSRQIVEIYMHYLLEPTFESLLRAKNERFIQLHIDEISGVISYFHEIKISDEINILKQYLYNDLSKEIFNKTNSPSINRLFNNSIRDLYQIFQKYNEPVSIAILKQENWNIDGVKMEIEKSEEDKKKVIKRYMDLFYLNTLIYISQIESLIDLSVDLKSKAIFSKTIGRYLNRGTFQDVVFDLDVGHPMNNNFNDIEFTVVKFDLNEGQRFEFIQRFLNKLVEVYLKASKMNLLNQSDIENVIDSSIYSNFLQDGKRYALTPIIAYLKGLNSLCETNVIINSNFEYSNNTKPLEDSLRFAFRNFKVYKNEILEMLSLLSSLRAKIILRNQVDEVQIIEAQFELINSLISEFQIEDAELRKVII